MNNIKTVIIIPLIILFYFSPFIAYLIAFGGFGFSSSQSEWATLGTFWGGIATPALTAGTIILLLFSYLRDREEIENIRKEKKVDYYMKFLDKAESILSEKEEKVRKFLPPNSTRHPASQNPRGTGSYPLFWEVVDAWNLYKNLEWKILQIDPENPIIEYSKNRYLSLFEVMCSLKYPMKVKG